MIPLCEWVSDAADSYGCVSEKLHMNLWNTELRNELVDKVQ